MGFPRKLECRKVPKLNFSLPNDLVPLLNIYEKQISKLQSVHTHMDLLHLWPFQVEVEVQTF